MATQSATPPARQATTSWPYRRLLMVVEGLISLSALAGSVQLMVSGGGPFDADLPLGLPNWLVSGLWLFTLVAVPAAVASWMCWRRSAHGPTAVLIASAGLGVDVAVQIPFIGLHVLQLVFGLIAVAMALLALDARRRGWPRRRR
jgi:hypothetical protein